MTAITSKSRLLIGYNQFLCAEALASGSEFSLALFEDLNKLIESVILYDHVVLLGDYELPSGIFVTPLKQAGILETFSNEKLRLRLQDEQTRSQFFSTMSDIFGPAVIKGTDIQPETILDNRISPNVADSLSYSRLFAQTISCGSSLEFNREGLTDWISENIYLRRHQGGHFYFLARAVLYSSIAAAAEMDYAPDLIRLPLAALAFTHEARSLPKRLYDAVIEKVQSEVEALILLGMPISVFIPPLTAKLLSRVDSPKQYADELLELREDFTDFRTAYNEFLTILKDPNVTLKAKIDAKKRMMSRVTGIIDSGESRHALNVKTIWDKLISSSLDVEGASTKLSLSGMVSILLDQTSIERTKGKARALFDLWTDSLNMKDHGALLESSFNTEIDPNEVKQYKKYSESLRFLIRTAGSSES